MADSFAHYFIDLEWDKLLIEAANKLGTDEVFELIGEKVTLFREKKKPGYKKKLANHTSENEQPILTPEEATILWASQQGGGSQNI